MDTELLRQIAGSLDTLVTLAIISLTINVIILIVSFLVSLTK